MKIVVSSDKDWRDALGSDAEKNGTPTLAGANLLLYTMKDDKWEFLVSWS